MDYVTLNNGIKMPMQGFGVFQISDTAECEQAVTDAIDVGYRLIDTASVYGNEQSVGAAIRKSGIHREELFVTTKAWISEMGYEQTLQAYKSSLGRLGLEYIDLYLIHMPFGDYYGAWRAMEEIYKEGRNGLFSDTILRNIGIKYGKSAAQVILRWHLQRGVVAIPKTAHRERMIENFSIRDFVLAQKDMDTISAMNTGHDMILDLHDPIEIERLYNIDCKN